MPQGIITKGIGGFYYIKHDCEIFECKIRGKFRKSNLVPMVGDNIEFDIISEGIGIITEILPRKNFIIRPPVANIDQVIIVFSTIHPLPNMVLIDKLIAVFENKNIDVVLCINKIDLNKDEDYKKVSEIYNSIGYKILNVSAKMNIGMEILKEELKNKVSSFAGNSGVGKSTILNRFITKREVETGKLSEKIERGKHTTRHVELFELDFGGYLLDTPGFNIIDIDDIIAQDLKYYYKDFDQYNFDCRFRGCNHINEPGCAVKQAVLDSLIDNDRYERYKIIYEELKSKKQY